jgi:glycosyltransferase involved in cell wall biosynthesis
MMEALKDEYDVTFLTWTPVDFASINRYYGTSLDPSGFNVSVAPVVIRRAIDLIPDPWSFQRHAVLMRWCKCMQHRYDLFITAQCETDFGRRGIQYVHYPYQEANWRLEPHHQSGIGWLTSFIKTRIRPWRIISGFSFDRMRRNKTLTNSEWTRSKFYEVYGADATTVYPPVPGDFPDVPWEEKEIGFVCIGRLSSEKRYEVIIDILAAVRSHIPEVHLHIIGSAVKYDQECYHRLKRKAKANNQWVFLHENISREELTTMVCRHRYGIHGMTNEHFGIAVAEMVRGGCIVFAPDSGGQVEIVGNEERLLYHTTEEAVAKILRVMNQPQEETELRGYLGLRKDLFTAEKFVRRIQEEVRDFLADGD